MGDRTGDGNRSWEGTCLVPVSDDSEMPHRRQGRPPLPAPPVSPVSCLPIYDFIAMLMALRVSSALVMMDITVDRPSSIC